MRLRRVIYLAFLPVLLAGCASVALRDTTIDSTRTISAMEQQQVLDNIAEFWVNPGALPHFAIINAASLQINDSGQASTTLTWNPFGLMTAALGFMGTRASNNQWTTQNVYDSDKLKKMRYLYRCVTHPEIPECLDGKDFYDALQKKPPRPVNSTTGKPVPTTVANAIVFDQCKIPSGFFGHGSKREVPKDACFVSRCGDCYVWVEPTDLDGLSRLTLMILDVASAGPVQTVTSFPTPSEKRKEAGPPPQGTTTIIEGGRIQLPGLPPGFQFSP